MLALLNQHGSTTDRGMSCLGVGYREVAAVLPLLTMRLCAWAQCRCELGQKLARNLAFVVIIYITTITYIISISSINNIVYIINIVHIIIDVSRASSATSYSSYSSK